MLRFLSIRHLAVIEAVEVEFGPGLNVLTGETGAGKSILVEAVGLLLGGRASADLVRTGEEVAAIEAIFETGGEEYLLRREITAQGRSRAFINGALVTAGALRDFCARVIEMHGQHEHQTLLDPQTHLAVLDSFGTPESQLASTAAAFDELKTLGEELSRTKAAAADRQSRLELATFQLAELDRAAPKPGEDEELATLRQVLSSAERVERLCTESYAALYESDAAALGALGGVWKRVGELATIEPRFQPYVEARDGIKSQLEDLAQFLRQYAEGIEASPERLQQVEDRLALLERLKRRHGPTLGDVLAKREALRAQLTELEQIDVTLEDLERRHTAARDVFIDASNRLSATRQGLAKEFAAGVESALAELAMERTRFEARFAACDMDMWTSQGGDRVEFYVSPNPGEELRPLARIVSGGELSRIMLGIKTLAAASRHGFTHAISRPASQAAPSLIFDEVDAGIGGRVADVVGLKLRTLASAFQVLCITHLPQIAAYSDSHYQISKRVERGRTLTTVRRLNQADRVDELSRMMGGTTITESIRATARELLQARAPGDSPAGESTAKGESERAKAKAVNVGRDMETRVSTASEPRERSAPTKRRASERVRESEGRGPSSK
jgi:DNA repair protein RecN (Recombination protein N)